ncbi:MAG: thiamine pyrophosphate-binding protein [Bryobacteraceae bacterium]
MKLSDYVVDRLADHGIRHVFFVTGGGAMHLNDSIGHSARVQYICNHHEQACAMAAEGYARITGRAAAINVTTGPGGINALNGVFGAWTDSIPMIVVSGQVKRETAMAAHPHLKVRQLGFQEADIISMVKGITKYAVCVLDPVDIAWHLDKALWLAESGRPGPVWIDIPVDVQGARIDPASLDRFTPPAEHNPGRLSLDAAGLEALIARARRPVLLAGSGIRCAGAVDLFRHLADQLGFPIVTSRGAVDVLPSAHPLHCGRTGTDLCTRAGNITLQNADLLIVLGTRLEVVQTGYNFPAFAPGAAIVQIDVDAAEFDYPTVRPHWGIEADARAFLDEWRRRLAPRTGDHAAWLAWCRERVERYPQVVRPRMDDPERPLNPYVFFERLFAEAPRDAVFACSNGASFIMSSQVAKLGGDQRLFFNSGCASMGHGLPAAIGAAFALKNEGNHTRPVICLEGDGSIQMNIQELATVAYHKLPLKIFVINNGGYLSMRATQGNLFGRLAGEGPANGVAVPNFGAIAAAYGIEAIRLDRSNYADVVGAVLRAEGPILAEVVVDPNQSFEPRVMARRRADGTIESSGLEDMWPYLDAAEMAANRIYDATPAEDLLHLARALQHEVPEPVAR